MVSWRKGSSSVSATSWESAVQIRPPASFRSRATASGVTPPAGYTRSVSPSRSAASWINTGWPVRNAVIAASTVLDVWCMLSLLDMDGDILVVLGALGRDDVGRLVDAVVGLDGRGITVRRAVCSLVVLPALDLDGFERGHAGAGADALVGEVDVERAGERLVAELVDELLHVARQGDVVASLAHAARHEPVQLDARVALEDAPVVGVRSSQRRLALGRDRDPLPVADDLALDVVRVVEFLQSSGGG